MQPWRHSPDHQTWCSVHVDRLDSCWQRFGGFYQVHVNVSRAFGFHVHLRGEECSSHIRAFIGPQSLTRLFCCIASVSISSSASFGSLLWAPPLYIRCTSGATKPRPQWQSKPSASGHKPPSQHDTSFKVSHKCHGSSKQHPDCGANT